MKKTSKTPPREVETEATKKMELRVIRRYLRQKKNQHGR